MTCPQTLNIDRADSDDTILTYINHDQVVRFLVFVSSTFRRPLAIYRHQESQDAFPALQAASVCIRKR